MDRRDQVREFVVDTFLFGDRRALSTSESLLDGGVIDSTGVLELIAFLEETFHVSVDDDEVQASNFDSIDAIARYLDRKAPATAPGATRA